MRKPALNWTVFIFFILILTGLACNVGGGEEAADTPEPSDTPVAEVAATEPAVEEAPTEAPVPAESGAVASLDELESAVVQIVAEGSFVDPEVGQQLNVAGSGSGFIVDPEGIAVTNNHVVTGAALLRVYVAGQSGPVNARVLGSPVTPS